MSGNKCCWNLAPARIIRFLLVEEGVIWKVFRISTFWLSYYILGCFNRQFLCTKPTAVSYFVVLMSLPPIAAIFVPLRNAMSSYKKHFIFKSFQIKNLTYSMIFQRRQKNQGKHSSNWPQLHISPMKQHSWLVLKKHCLLYIFWIVPTIKKWNVWWFSRKKI